jgi:SecD/SecF fusion protein
MSLLLSLIVALVVFVGSFLAGNYLARKFRMPDYGWKIGVSFFALLASAVVAYAGWPPKLGVDLSGGVILVYEVDTSNQPANQSFDMDKLIGAILNRVNPGGQKEVTVRAYGPNEVEIIIPQVNEEQAKQVERTISDAGTLEFRILADDRVDRDLIERARREGLSQNKILDSSGNILAWWIPVKKGDERSFTVYSNIATRVVKRHGQDTLEILIKRDPYDVTGAYLTRAAADFDQRGQPDVTFAFNSTGAQLFGLLTSNNSPDPVTGLKRELGIILDGQLITAPTINERISDRGEITGNFTQEEVNVIVNVLNAGSLPATLRSEPISKLFTGPTLGSDTIQKSTMAMIIASILVPLFMLVYYRFAGIVAVVVLALNMLMLMAIMISIKAAFTLFGFAGLALTVGMAVDNNVLVFERLREEMERGATLRMAIRNAFHRAGTTIIDCNLTHLLASTVLYVIGSDQMKGFAVTLWLGTAISIFTSVFVAHVVFDVAEKRGWVTRLTMMHVIKHTNIDFMGWFRVCATGSLAISIMAVVLACVRAKDGNLFDIDFTGGVSVEALFKDPQKIADIRRTLEKDEANLPGVVVSDVRLGDEPQGLRFDINTSQSNLNKVQDELKRLFADKLKVNSVEIAGLAAIEASKTAPQAEKTPAKPAAAAPAAATTTPAATKPPEVKAAAEKQPAAAKKAEAAPSPPAPLPRGGEGSSKPAPPKPTAGKKDQSRYELPPDSMLAMAGDAPLLLAQTAPPPASQSLVPAGKPVAAAEKPLNPFGGGSIAHLKFAVEVNHKTVEEMVTTALARLKLESTSFDVTNPDPKYEEGDATAYRAWDLKLPLPPEQAGKVLDTLAQQLKQSPFFPAASAIGGAVATSTRWQAIYALMASWCLIILYLWIRFQRVAFGVAAVIALIHDVLVMLGAVALSYYIAPFFGILLIEPFKINLPMVAAFLTIIGYSVNDTIVVFDRIREVRGKDPNLTRKMVNDSTNQTLSRTLLTSFTVFLVVVILYLFGGGALHGFAYALIAGVATGTYSSIYVAAPILLWMIGKHDMKPGADLSAGGRAAVSRR